MYQLGSLVKRLFASIIDDLIIVLLYFVVLVVAVVVHIKSQDNSYFSNLAYWLLTIAYNTYFIWRSGSTPGKKIFKLKVVNSDYQKVSFTKALIRESIGKIASALIFSLGFFWAIIDKNKQAWHDKIAKTYVVAVDKNNNLIQTPSVEQVSTSRKVLFAVLYLIFGLPLGFMVLFTAIYLFVGSPVQISGNSMNPNYIAGQYYLTNKLVYHFQDPQRGDVVIVKDPTDTSRDLDKRIIGVPGDTISLKNNQLLVNNELLNEPYLKPGTETKPGPFLANNAEVKIPSGMYFVLGDNRDFSSDSRQWGFVPRSYIISKISVCYHKCTNGKNFF